MQLMIYETAVPVSHARHGNWSLEVGTTYAFCRKVNSIPLMATEFATAALEYAVVFGGTGDVVMPAAVLGVRTDKNLYVTKQGGWQAKYIPAFVRRYPFVFFTRDEGKTFTLCIDENFAGFNQGGRGQRLFGNDGKPTPYVENVLKFLQQYKLEFQRTQTFCKKLKEPNLLDRRRQLADRTPDRAEVGLPVQGFVFCSFNNNWKITPEVFDVWMRMLKAINGSVLWLLRDNVMAEQNLRKEAGARGVDPGRLVFAPRMKLEDHLARHRLADLFLDTLPCNAHTTASDALWAGLPVLTCIGNAFAGRVAASLLHAIGLPELVTNSLADYEALALALARDRARLCDVKAKLARNRDTNPLFDTDRFRRSIEVAYGKMWEIWQTGEKPTCISRNSI